MSELNVHDRLTRVFEKVFSGTISVNDAALRQKEHAWPSMKHISLIISLEQEFGIRLEGEEAAEMTTIEKVELHIGERVSRNED